MLETPVCMSQPYEQNARGLSLWRVSGFVRVISGSELRIVDRRKNGFCMHKVIRNPKVIMPKYNCYIFIINIVVNFDRVSSRGDYFNETGTGHITS